MRQVILSFLVFLTPLVFANKPTPPPSCAPRLAPSEFLKDAPAPELVVFDYVQAMGPIAGVLTGNCSIRDRFDRAFFRYLLLKFDVLGASRPREYTFTHEGAEYRVRREPGHALEITRGTRTLVDWASRRGVLGHPNAAQALSLEERRESADVWLKLDLNLGLNALTQLLERELPPEQIAALHFELDHRVMFLEHARNHFNRNIPANETIDSNFNPRPRIHFFGTMH